MDTEAKYGLKGVDVAITLSKYIDVIGWRLTIIAVGMLYGCYFWGNKKPK